MQELASKAKSTAATYLATCAAAAPVTRDGKLVTDSGEIMMLTLVGGIDLGDKKLAAPHWCAEDIVAEAKAPLLFWRNVANTTKVGPVDRLSLMTIDEPPTWVVSANGIAGLVDKNPDKPTPYALSEQRGTATYFFAFYRGRPALATVGPLVVDIVTGKAKPIGASDGNTISVSPPDDGDSKTPKAGS